MGRMKELFYKIFLEERPAILTLEQVVIMRKLEEALTELYEERLESTEFYDFLEHKNYFTEGIDEVITDIRREIRHRG